MGSPTLAMRLRAEPQRTLDYTAITNAYMGIGTPAEHPVRILHVMNLTDETLQFSYDGLNDHFPLPANGFLLLDITANKSVSNGFFLAEGKRLYVKELGTPSSGAVYVTYYYGDTV